MKTLPFFVVFTLAFFVSKSQLDNDSAKKIEPNKVYIKTTDNKTIKASLRAVNDSQLVVANSRGWQWCVPAESIQSFSLKRKNSVGRGAMIGAGIDPLIISGAMIGSIVGALSKKRFTIDGSKETFRELQPAILSKVVRE